MDSSQSYRHKWHTNLVHVSVFLAFSWRTHTGGSTHIHTKNKPRHLSKITWWSECWEDTVRRGRAGTTLSLFTLDGVLDDGCLKYYWPPKYPIRIVDPRSQDRITCLPVCPGPHKTRSCGPNDNKEALRLREESGGPSSPSCCHLPPYKVPLNYGQSNKRKTK
jgi:hypothetical protein